MFLEQLENRSLLAVMVWDGSASNSWANAANWVGDVAPAAGDDLVFPAGAANLANVNDLAAGTRFNTILIQGSGYNITGAAIELAGGLTANNTTGSNTFGLDTTLINAQTFMSANPGTTLNVTGGINTANIVGSYFIGSVPSIVFDGQGDISASGVISGAGGLSKLGGGTLTLGGNSTFEGIAEARQGFIRVTHNNGLGSALTAHTEVQAGAALELSGVTIAENLAIREGGVGFGNGTDISSAGALRGVGGTTSTVTGNVEMIGGNNMVGVSAGSTLNISGQILAGVSTGTGRRLLKVGPGTLAISGSQSNIYPGDTVVLQGRLDLNKSGGATAIPGNLVIGDNIGGDNAAEVRLLGSDQIAQLNLFDVAINTITLASSGVLTLNGNSDVIGNLTLTTGSTYSSDVTTGAGTLTLGGNLTLATFQGSSGATPAATISGNLDLGSFFSGGAAGNGAGASRTFNIADTQLQHIATDLIISANITGTSDVAITQTGVGTLQLGGNNSGWSGPYIMQGGGVLELASNTALGGGLVSLQNNGNILRAIGASRTISNTISLDGNVTFLGDDNTPGVENLTFTGPATLTGDRTLLTMDPTQNVTFSGVIDEGIFASRSLAKSGRGVLTLTAANTYSGTTTVNADGGSLVLSGNGSLLNNGALTIGIASSLVLDNSGTVVSNRIDDARTISLQGRLVLRGNATASVTEFVGGIDAVQNVASIIEVENLSAGAFNSVLVANTLSVSGDRPTRFIGTGLPLSESGANRFEVTLAPGGLDDAILPQGVVVGPGNTLDFATYGSGPNGTAVIPLPASAYVTDLSQASATSNVRLTGANSITGNRSFNSILFDDGATLGGVAGSVLTINAGRLLFRGDGALTVPTANVVSGLMFVDEGHTATVSSNIFSGTIQKNGLGKLIISGDNQHTGNTLANEGVLNIQRSTAVGSPAAGTFARANASIELEQTTFGPVIVGLEPLTADGTGGLNNQGAIRNVAGNNSWAGTVTVNGVAANLLEATGGFPLANVSIPFVRTETGSTLTLTGDFPGAGDLAKTGGGTLELAGIIARGTDRTNRVLEGTMLLNNEPGIQASRGRYFIGSNAAGAPAATVRLGGSDQIIDDRGVIVLGSGLFDLNGNSELIGEQLTTHISVAGAGDVNIGTGGLLTVNANTQVFTQGAGNATGSTITGGSFALHVFGVIGTAASARTWQVNDGAVGNDLTITSSIVDGSGAQIMGITKSGFGQLEFSGTTANTYTGDTTVSEGVLILNKGTGTGGVDALSGRVFVGDNNPQSGFSGSDILRLAQPNQIPDFLAPVDLRTTGRWELNGNDETIGQADAQNALTLRASSSVDLGGATLTLNGNINTNAAEGATLWTPVVATRILNGTLALGGLQRNLDVPDRGELPYELEIAANIIGTGGFVTSNTGTVLLSGDNIGLSGDIVRNNGNFALGSDTALGSGRAVLNGSITTYGGKRTIATEILFGANAIGFIGGNNTASVGAIGGGGNDLEFTGNVNITAGTWQPSVPVAGQVEFSGQIGETLGGVTLRKIGFGTLILSNIVTLSGNIEVGQDFGGGPGTRLNGGTVIIRDQGTVLNMGLLIGANGVVQVDNSGLNLPNRFGDTALIDIFGGTLALVGKAGEISGESFGQLRPRNEYDGALQSLVPSAPGTQATWRFTSLAREAANQGSALRVSGRGADITPTGSNRIALNTTSGLLVDGIVPYAVLSGSGGLDFLTATNAAPTVTPFDNFLGALTSGANFATTLTGASGTVNVKLAANEAIAGSITANAILLPGGLVVSGAGTLVLDSGLLVGTGSNTVSVANLTLGGAEGLVFVDGRGSDLTVSSGVTAAGSTSAFSKAGLGSVIVGGANPNLFTGTTRVVNGVYRANKNSAFGTTGGNVRVTYGATVELNGVNVPAEQIDINGNGEANVSHVPLRTVAGSGTSTWNGTVSVNINRSAVEVNSGSMLVMAGAVNNQGMNKTGAGTLHFTGSAANGFVADNQNLTIWQGTVELNKTAGTNAMGAAGTNRSIVIGDNVGGPNADRLVLLQSNQIPDTNNLTITSTGQLDYGASAEVINVFSIQAGLIASGTITGTTGSLQINANSSVDGLSASGAGGSFGPATIAGTLVLGGTAPRVLTVNDTAGLTDLTMPAAFGAASVNFQKDGAGRLALSGNSSAYSGSITLNGGETVVQNANALGNATGNTTVNNGFSLLLDGVSLAEPLSLNGAGFGGPGAIRNISGNNSLTGTVTLAGTATIGVNAGQTLDVNAQITGGANGVTKLLPGTLRYSGGTANNYTGTTSVFEGILELNKTAGTDAIAGVLTVGNDAGPQDSDVVRLLAANQINNGAQVQVTPSGLLNLNNQSETIGNATQTGLNFFLGVTTAPRISTGTGTLALASGVGIQTQLSGGIAAATTSSPGATISGNLNLSNAAHNLNAVDAGLNIRELQIDAAINGGGATGTLSTSGNGLVYLTGNNSSLTGTTTINGGGGFVVGSNNALGTGTINVAAASNLFTAGYGVPAGSGTFTLANPITLNSDLTIRGDQNLILNGLVSGLGAANRTLTLNTHNNAAVTIGTAGISLSNDGTARTFTITNNTFNHTAATVNGPIFNGAGAANHAFQKAGVGWLTLTNNANTYAGVTTVAAGVLQVTAAGALGTNGSISTNQTTVNNGATLVVAPGITLPEWLVLNNNGFGNFGALRLLDTIPGTTQTATISGNVNFAATAFVGVDGGGANPDRLIFTGSLASGAGQTQKVGLGELEVAGAGDNGVTFTGAPSPFDDGLLVRQGTWLFNKTGALRAISGGTITIGDGGGGNNSARLTLIGSGTDQIGGNLNIDIGANGLLSFAGATTAETINQLQMFRLGSAAGNVDTTGAGTLTVVANVFASNAGLTTGATPAASVAGNLNLNATTRNVNASDSYVLNPAEDLLISAVIVNGGVNVNGDVVRSGTVALTGANIYAGGTTVTGQTVDFNQSFTHGLNTFVAGTLVVRDGGVLGTGNVTVQAGATLVLDNTAANANRIADGATVTMNAGNLFLIGNAGGSTETIATLTLNAGDNAGQANRLTVDSSAGGVTVLQTGSLTRGGSGTAEFIGAGANLGNATNSQINITGGTNPFVGTVIPWATISGPAGFDLVTDGDGSPATAPYSIGRVLAYDTDINTGSVVRLNGGTHTLTGDRTVNALLLEGGATVDGPFMLTVGSATAGLVVTRTGANTIATIGSGTNPGLQFAGREPLFLTETGSSLNVSGTINTTATTRKERGGSLILSGDNDVAAGRQITGAININAGTVIVSHEDALGSEPGGTVSVLRRAALVIDASASALNFGNKPMNILGLGLNDNGDGALQTQGANPVSIGTGATAINWNANPTVVSVGTGSTLSLNANVGGGGNPWIKRGAGELLLTGGTANSNTGTISINNGTVTLDKQSGVPSAILAINGPIVIDDLGNFDEAGGGLLRYATTGNSTNMIGDVAITVNHTGVFDINGKTDTAANTLTIQGGTFQNTAGGGVFQVNALTMTGGTVNTSATGTLNLNGTLTYTSGLATGGLPVIDGQLNLLGTTRTFAVNDGYNSTNDLTINAVISNGRVVKTGNGGLLLTNAGNTLLADVNEQQAFTVNAGVTSFTIAANIFGANLTTVPIPYSATTPAANIQAALERLSNIQPGNVLVTGAAGGPYNIQFTGALAGLDIAALTFTPTGGTITAGAVINGAHAWEVQNSGILAVGDDAALGNTGRLVMNGSFATLIPAGNRTLSNPVTLFPSLNLVFGGRRDFTGNSTLNLAGPISVGTPGTAQDLNIQIDDPLTNVIFSGVVDGGNSTGFLRLQKTGQGTLQLASANTFLAPLNMAAGIVRISDSNALGARTNELVFVQDTGAAYTLTFNGFTTASISTGSTAATVEARLNALPSIGGVHGSVTVTGTGVVNATTFDPFVIEFRDSLAGQDLVAMTATGATVMAITRNGAGTIVNANTALELQGSLNLGEEFITFVGVGSLPRTGTGAGFTGAIRALSGTSTIGTGKTPIQSGGGNGQVNYLGVETGASLILNGAVIQPVALPVNQFTHINKVGPGTLEFQGTTPNTYGTTAVLNGTLRLNKAPGVNAIPLTIGVSAAVFVGDNVGVANSDQLVLVQAEQIPDGSAVTVMGSGQVTALASQAASASNEVQQVFIPNAAPTGQYRLQFNGVSTGDIAFGSGFGVVQAALNALSTIGGVGGSVVVQGNGTGQNQFYTVTFLGSLAGTNVPELKVLAGTTAFGAVTPAVTTLTTGGIAGHETIGATTLRVANQGAGNISLQTGSTLGLQLDVIVDTYGSVPLATVGAAITGGTLELRQQSSNGVAANRTFTVADVPGAADDLRIDAAIADGSLGSISALNKTGVGASRLVLGGAGANNYAGSTTVTAGILQIEKGNALGTALPDEVQNYIVNNVVGAATGQYTLTFNAATTAGLDPRATADEVAAALNALATIGGVGGSVSVVQITTANTGLQYFVRFGGSLAATDVAQITINTNTLGGGATIGAVATSQGGGLANIAAAQTTVNAGQQLEIDNAGTITNEQLTFSGSGPITETTAPFWNNGLQAAAGTGAVRNIAGNNLWTSTTAGLGNQVMGANPSSVGAVVGSSLTFGGLSVLSGAQHLGKTGPGTLELGGSVTNTYTGNTYINEGTLRLNKSGAAIAINGGEIMLGDNVGGDNADVILYAPTAGTDQIGNRVVRITSSGLFNLNGVNEINNNGMVLDVGPTFSGDIQTGAGVLTNNNQFTAVNQAGTTATSVPATVSGIYDLAAGTRNVDAREGNAPVELLISAVIQGGAVGITKVSRGTLALTGNNTYTGTTTLNNDSGTLLANTPSTVAASPYTVNAGSVLGGTGTITGAVTVAGVAGNLTIGGVINPGPKTAAPANTGILTVNNNVSFGAGAQLQADINGTTVGTQYDQLVVGGTGTVTTTGNAVPNISNTSTIAGTLGSGFQPVNLTDAFKLISKTSAGTITVGLNSFLSFILPQPPQTSPTTVTVGGKTFSTSYNVNSGLNDGNDFVLQAVAGTRVWDGRIDNSILNVSDAWTLNTNWVGDVAPFAGDDIVFSDVGVGNGKTTPVNDYVAGFDFRSINFTNTTGSYTVTGNSVLLNAATGGVTSDNLTDVAVTNSLNIPLTTAASAQTVTVKDGSTLNLGGTINLVSAGPLTVTNGVTADANGTAVFGGTINGTSTLTIDMIGDATFNAAIGGGTALNLIDVITVDDLSFNSTIAATTVSQAAGTGLTTLSGGSVGTLNMTNEAFSLAGGTLSVTGAATLNATVGSIADGNGAANNLTGPSLNATAVTGINLDTTIVDLTASNTGAGNVAIDDANGLNILGLSVANGNAVITAGGALTDGATAVTSISGNGSFSAPTITLGDAAGDAFNVGSLTFPSSGTVTITEDSATQLSGTSAATSLNLTSAAAITNAASTNLLITNNASLTGTSITLGDQLGDLINFGTLTFTSGGAVNISEDSALQLAGTSTADSASLSSTGLLDNAAAASVTVTNNASFTAPTINLGGAAGDSLNFGTLTFAATAGTATIAEDSSLDLAGASTATGAILLTSVDVAAVGQNINLPLGASVQSTTSSITLNAGDDALIAGMITSALTTTINVDAGDFESNGVPELVVGTGGSVTITGVINTPAVGSGGGTFLNGGDDFDTFTLSPQTTTEFRINGNLPVSQDTGDILALDVSGTTTPTLTVPGSIAPFTGPGSGAWSFTSAHRSVLFTSIEDSTTTGNYHLTYDNSIAPVGNVVVMRDAAQTRLQIRSGTNAGPILFQGLLSPIQSLRVLGSAGNDIVTVDAVNTLPNFGGTVPGVTDNGNLAGTGEFLFDGLGGTDTLVYAISGATASQTYAIGNGTGAAGLEGEIESIADGVNLLTYFQNVELTQRTGVGATPGGLSILGDLAGNAFATTANNPFTRTTATGYTPFEFSGNNYSDLTVSAGDGLDTLELLGIGNGQVAPLPSTFNGDAGNDTLRVHSTADTTNTIFNTGTITLNGGLGDDLFQLFSLTNTVDGIGGPVVVDGTDGNVGGNTDTLVIVDTGDTTLDNVFINAVNPGVSDEYRVEGINTAATNDVTFRNIDTLDYTGTQASDAIDARFVNTTPQHDLTTVSLSGWLGGDQFLLFTSDQIGGSGPGVTPTGVWSGVANISLYGDAPGNPNAADGNDIFGENPPPPFTGTGIMNVGLAVPDTTRMIRPSVNTSIAIDGGQPTGVTPPLGDAAGDVHNLDISALPNSTPVIVSTFGPGTVVAPGISPLTWTQIEDINLVDQGLLTNVQMGDLFARTTPNPDLVQITRNPTLTNPDQVRLRITATIGNYSASNKTIIYAGGMNDTITQANLTIPAEFYGEDGDDYLTGAMNNDWLVGGLGNDRINASGGDNVVWGDNAPTSDIPNPQDTGVGGNDTLSALSGNDVFYGGAGNDLVSAGAGDDYASGGQGNDTLDGFDGNDRLYGGSGIDVISGHAGNDLISGGDGDDRLYGGDGNDVVFGGSGVDEINGGNGNDLLVTGSVANENTVRTSVASVSNYSPATYTDGTDNDAALLILLTQWGSSSNSAGIAAITHDGVDDDVFGSLGDDDFCWEEADIADDFPAVAPPDYNAFSMGADQRFGPT